MPTSSPRALHDAERFGVREAWLRGSPFSDSTIPAPLPLALADGMLVAAALGFRRHRRAAAAAIVMGALLLVVCDSSGAALVLLGARMRG
jgi:hypothetical protein